MSFFECKITVFRSEQNLVQNDKGQITISENIYDFK